MDSENKNNKNPVLKFFGIILTAFLSWILLILVIFTLAAGAVVYYAVKTSENVSEIEIPEREKERSSYIYQKNSDTDEYELIYKVTPYTGDMNLEIDANELPFHVKSAFICIEDERFYSHDGVDILSSSRALINELLKISGIMNSETIGGSTITQQLVKNLTHDDDVSADRKIREIFRAMRLEQKYSKDEILNKYLNIVYFGQDTEGCNMYGIEAAAIGYFGKHASDLTPKEASCLASALKNPSLYGPVTNFENNSDRSRYCLRKMFEQGVISPSQYEKSLGESVVIVPEEMRQASLKLSDFRNTFKNPEPSGWVIDEAVNEFSEYLSEAKNISEEEARNAFFEGGYELYLTIDDKLQKHLEEKYEDDSVFPDRKAYYTDEEGTQKEERLQSAIVVMDYKGKIKGIVGRVGKKTESFCWSNAVFARRQPGSSIKPLSVYSYGIENDKITWSSLFTDEPLFNEDDQNESWPKNYSDTYSHKQMTVNEFLENSYNTLPAFLCDSFGTDEVFKFTTETMRLKLDESTDNTIASLSLGATGTGPTLLSLANSYMVFGNGGKYYKAHILSRIKDSGSKRVYAEPDAYSGKQIISEETAFIMNKMLRNVVVKGTGQKARLKHKFNIGKTGTTENYRDILFAGLTEDYVSAIWIGFENSSSPDTIRSLNSGAVWKEVFGDYADTVKSGAKYPECDSVISSEYCSETGEPASPGCPVGGKGWYKKSTFKKCTRVHKKAGKAEEAPVSE